MNTRIFLRLYQPVITLLALCAIAAIACKIPASTEKPTQATTQLLFQDDFSDPSSGWNRVATNEGETNYTDNVYRIFVNSTDLDIWAKPGLNFIDARIEVDAYKVDGERNNRFGILCRVDGTNFYAFLISSDGYYGIGKVKDQVFTLLGMDTLQPSPAIRIGSDLNHLRADCIGSQLTFYVNNQKIAEADDSEFKSGDVGLMAGTYDTPGTDIRFDNFAVYRP